jgi:hypothetical protein
MTPTPAPPAHPQPAHLATVPVPGHTVVSGGMPGWQITLNATSAPGLHAAATRTAPGCKPRYQRAEQADLGGAIGPAPAKRVCLANGVSGIWVSRSRRPGTGRRR